MKWKPGARGDFNIAARRCRREIESYLFDTPGAVRQTVAALGVTRAVLRPEEVEILGTLDPDSTLQIVDPSDEAVYDVRVLPADIQLGPDRLERLGALTHDTGHPYAEAAALLTRRGYLKGRGTEPRVLTKLGDAVRTCLLKVNGSASAPGLGSV